MAISKEKLEKWRKAQRRDVLRKDIRRFKRDKFAMFLGLDKKFEEMLKDEK